jgi:hypothetical protein
MKGLLVIIGEAFRLGGQGTHVRDVSESLDEQVMACDSHIKFANEFDLDIQTFIYETKYVDILRKTYKDRLVSYTSLPELLGWDDLFVHTLKNIKQDYDYFLIVRVDLFLKPYFTEIFQKFKGDKDILFPSICFTLDNKHITKSGTPRVSDIMLYFHKIFYEKLVNMGESPCNHEGWNSLAKVGIIPGTMVETLHDSDSFKDYNPMYRIVNRPESKTWYSQDLIFSRNFPDYFLSVSLASRMWATFTFVIFLILLWIVIIIGHSLEPYTM